MPSFSYAQGYQDALFDVRNWFANSCSNQFYKSAKLKKELIIGLLDAIYKNDMLFMKLKDNFYLRVLIPKLKDKKDKRKTVILHAPTTEELHEKLGLLIGNFIDKGIWEDMNTEQVRNGDQDEHRENKS